MANPTKQQAQALSRLHYDSDFQQFRELLRAELEDTKAALVEALQVEVPKLQGYAQALNRMLSVTAPTESTPKGRTF